MFVCDIHRALCAGGFHAPMELTDETNFETNMLTNDVESTYEQCTHSTVETVFPHLESQLRVHLLLYKELDTALQAGP